LDPDVLVLSRSQLISIQANQHEADRLRQAAGQPVRAVPRFFPNQPVDVYTLGQLLPGPNVLNLTVIVGHRFAGWTGAAAGVAGFLGWPCLVVVGMGVLYQHYGALPYVQQALTGMSSVAAGLLLATVIKLATVLPRHWRPWLFGILAFAAVGIMRWPLLWVMGALGPWAVFAAWKEAE
jgi:chromate transporter